MESSALTHTSQKTSIAQRAVDLRERARAAGEPGWNVRVTDLLNALPLPYPPEPVPEEATDDERREALLEPLFYVDGLLTRYGMRVRPHVVEAGPGGVVNVRPTSRFAMQGAFALAITAVVVALPVSRIAVACLIPFALAGVALVWAKWPLLDRVAPKAIPRGRILGAGVVALFLLIAMVAVVAPTRAWVKDRGDRANAIVNADVSVQLLASGDVTRALLYARAGHEFDADAPGVAAALADAEAAAQGVVDTAASSQADGRWDEAQALLASLQGLNGTEALAAKYRLENAKSMVIKAESALAAGDAGGAFDAYNSALRWDPTVADDWLVFRIASAFGVDRG